MILQDIQFFWAPKTHRAARAQGGGILQDLRQIHLQDRPQIQTMLPVGVLFRGDGLDGLVAEVTIGDSMGILGPWLMFYDWICL